MALRRPVCMCACTARPRRRRAAAASPAHTAADTDRATTRTPWRRRIATCRKRMPAGEDALLKPRRWNAGRRGSRRTDDPPGLRASGARATSTQAVSLPAITRCRRSHVVNGSVRSACSGHVAHVERHHAKASRRQHEVQRFERATHRSIALGSFAGVEVADAPGCQAVSMTGCSSIAPSPESTTADRAPPRPPWPTTDRSGRVHR